MGIDDSLPTDLASAHALIVAQRQALSAAEIRAAAAESEAQYRALLIETLKFTIRKLRHDRFGQSSERGALLLDQLELLDQQHPVLCLALRRRGSQFSRTQRLALRDDERMRARKVGRKRIINAHR